MPESFDALLLVSFGGPEGPEDVLPFLENVLRGRNVPRERLLEVADHYAQFGGVSPINGQNRELIAALETELRAHSIQLPIYLGNRNWHPLLPDTLRQMAKDGVHRPLAFFTSAFSSYSGCRQYLENIAQARAEVGPAAPRVEKLRAFFNHPGFIAANCERMQDALAQIPDARRTETRVLYTAHSIPLATAQGCSYEEQLKETCRLVSEATNVRHWELVYQSRSGPPTQPWLEPDVGDALGRLSAEGLSRDVVIAPIGFLSDHIEVLFDLDMQAKSIANELGLNMIRAATVGTHPRFVAMIRELIEERLDGSDRATVGRLGPLPDVCPEDCCPPRPSAIPPRDASA